MTERLFQFIWQFQHFSLNELQTEQGEPLLILHPGLWNTNQGPDFLSAKVKIGETTWAGNIELHILTSDWYKHFHQADMNFKNIILHVVWRNDQTPDSSLFKQMPVLELQSRVSVLLLQRYEELMNNVSFVPCERNLKMVKDLVWISWKERLLIERLQRKSAHIMDFFEQSNHHWEETFWWIIARNFGIRVNADSFEAIAQTIPVNILTRHKHQIHELEALLFGQSGLLERKFEDAYPLLLQKEYRYFQKKYQLPKVFVAINFFRMRPSAFPSIRLAQLAMLVHQSTHLFSRIKETVLLSELRLMLNVTANDYWHYHYRFEEISAFKIKKLGDEMVENILINTVVPVLFAYGAYIGEPIYQSRILGWLEEMDGEKNRITKGWSKTGISNLHAYDSQALTELKTQYCDYKRCLDCAIGNALLRVVES